MSRWMRETARAMGEEFRASVRREAVRWAGVAGVALIAGVTTVAVKQPQLVESLLERFDGDSVWVPERVRVEPHAVGMDGAVIDLSANAVPVLVSGGGAVVESGAAVPSTPSISDILTFAATGDSIRWTGSAYSGDGSHDSTQIQIDTAGGNFSAPKYTDTTMAAITVDTVPPVTGSALDSGAVIKMRMRYQNSVGWSAWSDTLQETLVKSTAPALIFASDWSDSTGKTEYALLDSGGTYKWGAGQGVNGDGTDPLDVKGVSEIYGSWPAGMTNVLAIQYRYNSGTDSRMIRTPTFDSLSTGDTIWYRFYYMHPGDADATSFGVPHFFQPANANSIADCSPGECWWVKFQTWFSTFSPFYIERNDTTGSGGNDKYEAQLDTGVVYRFELALDRSAVDTMGFDYKIFDESISIDSAIWDNANISGSDQTFLVNAQPIRLPLDAAGLQMRDLVLGQNGSIGVASDTVFDIAYIGGFAVSIEGWIGAYDSTEAN